MSNLFSVPVFRQPIADCRRITCIYGDSYIEHHMKYGLSCRRCYGINRCYSIMVDNGYTVITTHPGGITNHTIKQCPVCNGLDLEHWAIQNKILEYFNSSGYKVYMYPNRS